MTIINLGHPQESNAIPGIDQYKLLLQPSHSCIGVVKPQQDYDHRSARNGHLISFSYEYLQNAVTSASLINQLFIGILNTTRIPLPSEDFLFLTDIVEKLKKEIHSDHGMKEEAIRILFQIFILYLSRASSFAKPIPDGAANRHALRFFSLLDQHFDTLHSPSDYAGLMAVTPGYLNYTIKESLGFPTRYFIQQRLLAEAKRLMTHDRLSMKEIAYKLGFFDLAHFSKFFKRASGSNYTSFRKAAYA